MYHWVPLVLPVRVRALTSIWEALKRATYLEKIFYSTPSKHQLLIVLWGHGSLLLPFYSMWNFVRLDLGQILFMFSQSAWVQYTQLYCCVQKIKFCWWAYTAVAFKVFMTPLPLWLLSLERMMTLDVPSRANYPIVSILCTLTSCRSPY